MANNVYPPDHLLRKWESLIIDEEQNVDVVLYEVFQAGADQELEACCKWIVNCKEPFDELDLYNARRPKPPSLKELALASVKRFEESGEFFSDQMRELEFIRKALEQLND